MERSESDESSIVRPTQGYKICKRLFQYVPMLVYISMCCMYLQVVSRAALSSIALNLERTLEGDGSPEACGHHHMPATVQTGQVVVGVLRTAQHPSVYMQQAPTTLKSTTLG